MPAERGQCVALLRRGGLLRAHVSGPALIAPVFACAVVCASSLPSPPRAAVPSESVTANGPFQVARLELGMRDGSNRATVTYPLDAQPPFALMVFCPGYLGSQASHAAWAPLMASRGTVFMHIDTCTPDRTLSERRQAELAAFETLESKQTREGSPLCGKLDLSCVSLLGWSLGGGGGVARREHAALDSRH